MVRLIAKSYAETLTARTPLCDTVLPFNVVTALSSALTPAWAVEREIDPSGDLSVIVMAARDDAVRPTFVLYEEDGLVQVSTIVDEQWQFRQTYPTCKRAVDSIVAAAVLTNS